MGTLKAPNPGGCKHWIGASTKPIAQGVCPARLIQCPWVCSCQNLTLGSDYIVLFILATGSPRGIRSEATERPLKKGNCSESLASSGVILASKMGAALRPPQVDQNGLAEIFKSDGQRWAGEHDHEEWKVMASGRGAAAIAGKFERPCICITSHL